jgi:hypothetical protein
VIRAALSIDTVTGKTVIANNSAGGVEVANLKVSATGIEASYGGAVDKRVFDLSWFPQGAGVLGVVDFPVGTDLFFTSNDGAIVNRNVVINMRAGTSYRTYQANGSDPLLAGTWVSNGSFSPASNSWLGTARRVA